MIASFSFPYEFSGVVGIFEEKFYLHPMIFFTHPIKEMECKYEVCVI